MKRESYLASAQNETLMLTSILQSQRHLVFSMGRDLKFHTRRNARQYCKLEEDKQQSLFYELLSRILFLFLFYLSKGSEKNYCHVTLM